jgi:addiction module HigA family antidote
MKTSIKLMHPGVFLLTQVIDPLGLSIDQVAAILGVTRPSLSALLLGKVRLEPEMAWRWEQAFDIGMEGMLRMQAAYDTTLIRSKAPDFGIKPYIPHDANTRRGGLVSPQVSYAIM